VKKAYYRKLSREKYRRILALLESGATGLEEEDSGLGRLL